MGTGRAAAFGVVFSVLGAGSAAAQGGVGASVPVNCAIRPLQVVEVAAPFGGVISEVFVRPGQTVETGDPLVEFDSDLTRASYEAARARAMMTASLEAARRQHEMLQKKVERLQSGARRSVVSAADLEAAQLELATAEGTIRREQDVLDLAEIDARQAKVALDKNVVLSPASGQVGEDLIDRGEAPGVKPIAVIYVIKPLRVEAFVPTAILGDFLARNSFEIVVNGDRASPVPVKLDYVSQVADLSSNSQSVYFTLDAADILPGYQCVFLSKEP